MSTWNILNLPMTVLMSWMLNPLKNRWSELGWSPTNRRFHFWRDPKSVVFGSEMVGVDFAEINPAHCSDSLSSFLLDSFLPSFPPFIHQSSSAYSYLDSKHPLSYASGFGYLCFDLFGMVWMDLQNTGVRTSSPRLLEDSKHGAWGKAILSGRVVDEPLCLSFSCEKLVHPESKREFWEGLSLILFDWICIIKQIHDMILI